MAVILVMMDGVGVAAPGAQNAVTAGMPELASLGIELTTNAPASGPTWRWQPIDGGLGVPGLPQSGTGHASLWGGFNAPALIGRHQPSYPTVALRERLAAQSLFTAVLAKNKRIAWANGHVPGYFDWALGRRNRLTAGTWAAFKAGVRMRTLADLEAGHAVGWDIDQRLASQRQGCEHLPHITPATAAQRLLDLAQTHDLVAFETYLPDLAGHERLDLSSVAALQLVDGLLAALISNLLPDDTLIVTSDHGNVEDLTTRIHTLNPVPLLLAGHGRERIEQVQAIDGVMDLVLSLL